MLILLIVGLVGISSGLVMLLTDPYTRLFEWVSGAAVLQSHRGLPRPLGMPLGQQPR